MDIDRTRKAAPVPGVCHRCHKPGHFKADCPSRFDVRFMTMEEKDDLIQGLLAAKDAAEAEVRLEDSDADFA